MKGLKKHFVWVLCGGLAAAVGVAGCGRQEQSAPSPGAKAPAGYIPGNPGQANAGQASASQPKYIPGMPNTAAKK